MKNTISVVKRKAAHAVLEMATNATLKAHTAVAATKDVRVKLGASTKSALESTNATIVKGLSGAAALLDGATTSASSGVRTSFAVAQASASNAGHAAKAAGKSVGTAVANAAGIAGRTVSTVATTIMDQNGDGKLDEEDLKILAQKGTEIAKTAATQVGVLAKDVAQSELVKDTAAAAAVGAAIAIPVPLVGPVTGAVVGAIVGAYSHLRKNSIVAMR